MRDDYDDQDDPRAQAALEIRLSGWQVHRTAERRWSRGVEIPAGHYWAAHWHSDEPLVVAADLAELERLVAERTPPERSVMRELLGPELSTWYQVADGVFYLPGPLP